MGGIGSLSTLRAAEVGSIRLEAARYLLQQNPADFDLHNATLTMRYIGHQDDM